MWLSKLLSPPPLPRSDKPIMSLRRCEPAKLSPWQRRDSRPRPSVRSIGEPAPQTARPPRLVKYCILVIKEHGKEATCIPLTPDMLVVLPFTVCQALGTLSVPKKKKKKLHTRLLQKTTFCFDYGVHLLGHRFHNLLQWHKMHFRPELHGAKTQIWVTLDEHLFSNHPATCIAIIHK